jgi:serine/threonine-protein kinase
MVFDAANPSRALRQHLFDEPEPPSRHSPHRVPPELDALVLSCLAKEPEERPAALELGQRLEGCAGLAGWTPSHADAWWREHLS